MMDKYLNTKEKRFIVSLILFVIFLYGFLLKAFRFLAILNQIKDTQGLMLLTNSNLIDLYFPMRIITQLLDTRLSALNIVLVIFQNIPLSIYLLIILSMYASSKLFDSKHKLYKYQQIFMGFTILLVFTQLLTILLFLYGFLGGSVASVIQRIHLSSLVGMISIVVLCLGYLFLLLSVLLKAYQNKP